MAPTPDLEPESGALDGERPQMPHIPITPIPGMGVSDSHLETSHDYPRQQQQVASRLFNSRSFRRLWFAQVASSTGDWLGFFATTVLAARLSDVGVAFVLAVRLIPGLLVGPVAGVLADRVDRRNLMVVCDISRGVVLMMLPFVENIGQLILVSFILEGLSLLWMPAKEASTPALVEPQFLPTANSLSLAAAYGTIPVAALIFIILTKVAEISAVENMLSAVNLDQNALAFVVDGLTFFVSAVLIFGLAIPRRTRESSEEQTSIAKTMSATFNEFKEGVTFIKANRRVRAVIFALATGLIGGGVLVPLGPDFAKNVLGAGDSGFGTLQFGLGMGAATGVIAIMLFQRRMGSLSRPFVVAIFGAGACIAAVSFTNSMGPAVFWVGALGFCAGGVYVLGFSILGATVEDEMRGRTFAALYTLIRVCLVTAIIGAVPLANWLDSLSNRFFGGSVELFGTEIMLPGARLTLLLGSLFLVLAGFIALFNMRPETEKSTSND